MKQRKRIIAFALAVAMVFSTLPMHALAAPTANDAGFTITDNTGSEGTYTYEDGVLIVQDNADLTISTGGQTSHRIVVAENAEATITLNGVHIVGGSATGGADPFSAIDIANNASLLLQLADSSTNSLTGGNGESGDGAPGIHVPEEAELTILGSGSLTVAGGTGGYGGSGIGGTHVPGPNLKAETCGTVIILATGEISISGGESGPGSSPGNDIGGGKGLPEQAGGDGGGIRPTGNGSYVVWGEQALPEHPESYTIPEGATLTIPRDATLTIPQGVTLANHGTITGEGNLNGDGILTGSGVVTVLTNHFQKTSALTLTIENAEQAIQTGAYHAPYQSQITLKAEIKQTNTRVLSAGDYNTVTFYVGDDDSKAELGTAEVQDNKANLPLTLSGDTWNKGFEVNSNNIITAEFSGHSHLKPATGTVMLYVSKGNQPDPPDAPSGVSDITATSVTLKPMTNSNGKGSIQYGCITGTETSPTNWQSSPTFENLIPATTYTFYTRYAENDFYKPSASSSVGLKVVTAPSLSAVSVNYKTERITFVEQNFEVSPNQNFSTLFQTNESILAYLGLDVYVRAKVEEGTQAQVRGVTTVSLPFRPNYANGITAVNASAAGVSDGKITGVSANMEYRLFTAESWTPCTGSTIDNLTSGTYEVRTKATENSFASLSKKVTIGVGNVITIILPTFDPVHTGYTQPDPKPIEICNSGDEDATIESVSCIGVVFKIQPEPTQDLLKLPAHGKNTHYALQPEPGMVAGEYTSPITVTYRDIHNNVYAVTATAHFTVLPKPTSDDEDDGYFTISANAGEGGTISPSDRVRVREGRDRTFTITPDEGYIVADVLVDGVSVKDRLVNGQYTFEDVQASHTIEATFINAIMPFVDVPMDAWYHDAVYDAYTKGLMVGTDATHFSPLMTTSRGMIVTMLYRLAGSPSLEDEILGYPYEDVNANAYYANAVYWARMNDIVSGYSADKFGPNDPITREQLAGMLMRFAAWQGDDVSARADLSAYSDADKVSGWASDAVQWAVAKGYLAGTGDNTLSPQGQATRAQTAAVFTRVVSE